MPSQQRKGLAECWRRFLEEPQRSQSRLSGKMIIMPPETYVAPKAVCGMGGMGLGGNLGAMLRALSVLIIDSFCFKVQQVISICLSVKMQNR